MKKIMIICLSVIFLLSFFIYGLEQVSGLENDISGEYTQVSFDTLLNISNDINNSLKSDYWIGKGAYAYFTLDNCAEAIKATGKCLGLNPSSPYGLPMVPLAPGESPFEESVINKMTQQIYPENKDLSIYWRMRSDEAIIIIALNPPKSKYFSYIPYIITRDKSKMNILARILSSLIFPEPGMTEPGRHSVWASFGIPLNNKVIKSSNPDNPYNAASVIILTADKELDSKLRTQLLTSILPKYGIKTDIINTLEVPDDILFLGYGKKVDKFQLYGRVAFPENQTEADAYYNNPPVIVLRIVPNSQEKTNSKKFSFTAIPNKATNISEKQYSKALDLLVKAVELDHNAPTRNISSFRKAITTPWLKIKNCVAIGFACGGDDQDAFYTMLDWPLEKISFPLIKNNSDDFMLVVGMNHVATGKATYSNFAVYDLGYGMGVKAISDTDFNGSANKYLKYLPSMISVPQSVKDNLTRDIDKFFVYKIARDCKGESYCYTLAQNKWFCNDENGTVYDCYTQQEKVLGVDYDRSIFVFERAYLDPQTNLGPEYKQMLPSYFIKYEQI